MTTAETHTFTGAYAVHALAGPERARFHLHLGDCDGCAEEVRELTETATRLGATLTTGVCPTLRDRVLTEVAVTRQVPRNPCCTVTAYEACRRRPDRVAVGVAFLATVAAVVGAVVTGTRLGDSAPPDGVTLGSVIAAPDAVTNTATDAHGGSMTAVLSPSRGEIVVTATGLPALEDAHTYQVWLLLGDGPRSAGLLVPASGGFRPVMTDFRPGTRGIAITAEPVAGSPRPTGSAVLRLDLT